jgi:pSer/pThr/pTyr-binding forkhead associated (FHA) protein
MPKILVKRKAEVFQEFEIPPNAVKLNIGTETDNELVINDKKVSMNHLQILRQGEDYFVKDLRSAFGSFLNGQLLEQQAPMRHGDEIQIGQHTLIFLDDDSPSDKSAKVAPAGLTDAELDLNHFDINDDIATPLPSIENIQATSFNLDLENYAAQNTPTPRTPTTEMATSRPGPQEIVSKTDTFLLAIYGPYTGKKFQLTSGETKIGRDTKLNDIVIRLNKDGNVDPSISRRHATIYYVNGEYFISDKRSKTRTHVNQHRLGENDKFKLNFNDEIEIVSDQQSSIFRVCHESHLDFSPPKLAGVWWVRFQWPLLRGASVLFSLLAVIILVKACGHRAVVKQVPDPLELHEQVWIDTGSPKQAANSGDFEPSENFTNTPALGDLNGDGEVDLVFLNSTGQVQVISGASQTPLWEAEEHIRAKLPGQVVLADLNGDEREDVLLCTATDRLVAIDGHLGVEIWSSSITGGGFAGLPAVADVTGDGRPDVAITTQAGTLVLALGGLSDPEWQTIEIEDRFKSTPSAVDVTGDGVPEFILGTESGMLYIYQGISRKFVSKLNVSTEIAKSLESDLIVNVLHCPVSAGLLDADVRRDLIISTNKGNLLALNGVSKKQFWVDSSMPDDLISNLFLPTVTGDLDRDGLDDVISITFDGRIRALKGADPAGSQKLVLWEFLPEDWEKFVANPALADFNKDGVPDVVTTGVNHGLYIIHGQNGSLLWKSDFGGNNPPVSAPVVGDLNHDSFLEVIILRADKKIYSYQSNSRYPAGTILWAQRFANPQNDGNAPIQKLFTLGYNLKILLSLLVIFGIIGLNLYWLYQHKQVLSSGTSTL